MTQSLGRHLRSECIYCSCCSPKNERAKCYIVCLPKLSTFYDILWFAWYDEALGLDGGQGTRVTIVVTYKKGQPTLSVCLRHGTHQPLPSYPPPHNGVRFTTTRAVNIKWRIIISSAIKYPINLWIPSHKVSIIIIIILILHSSGSGSTACVLKVDTRYPEEDDDDQERICYYMAFVAPQATTTTNR